MPFRYVLLGSFYRNSAFGTKVFASEINSASSASLYGFSRFHSGFMQLPGKKFANSQWASGGRRAAISVISFAPTSPGTNTVRYSTAIRPACAASF